MNALPFGCLHERWEDTVRSHAAVRSCPEAYFAENDHVPKRLLGVIVRGRYAGNAQEGKDMFLFRTDEKRPQGLGWLEGKGLPADALQFLDEPFFNMCGILPGDIA